MTTIQLHPDSIDDYRMFLAVKRLPKYTVTGRTVWFPDEYAAQLGLAQKRRKFSNFEPSSFLFDYQRDIVRLAVKKRKYCVFADCGLGKTMIMLDFAIAAQQAKRAKSRILIVSPLMVVKQTMEECRRWYGERLDLRQVRAHELADWMRSGSGVAITNYDAIAEGLPVGTLDGLILDESSMLKSHYGAWGTRLIELGRGVEWKLCLTGTPAPNDRIEYANHAVFMDAFPTVNSFLARFFVNRGQTQERWEMKHHAIRPFYTALSHWCIFLSSPATYGWKDNCGNIPPIHVHVHDVPITRGQRDALMDTTGTMFVSEMGGIGMRGKIGRIGKGFHDGERIDTHKTQYVRSLVDSWPDESTIIWCKYNAEQDDIAEAFPGCANIDGSTPIEERERLIDAFKAGTIRVLVTKPKILGFGLNLQVATRQVFSTLQDSYEEFYQAVKRSNRIGSHRPLNVHIPVTELERPMIETVLTKSGRVTADTEEQERIFREFQEADK